jgi:hypothetical protein
MLSTSDGRMATIHSDQMVSWPFHPAAVYDVRRPKLKKDESEYFLEKLSSYIYQRYLFSLCEVVCACLCGLMNVK